MTSSLDRRGQGTTASAGGGRTIMSTLRRNRRVVTEDGDGYECRSGKGGSGARRGRGVFLPLSSRVHLISLFSCACVVLNGTVHRVTHTQAILAQAILAQAILPLVFPL